MPTEKQIEAGCKAFVAHLNEQGGDNAVWPHDFFESDQAAFRSMVSGIILAAYEKRDVEQTVPDGWVLVPSECTDEIAEAIASSANCCGGIAETTYRAILAATEKPDSKA